MPSTYQWTNAAERRQHVAAAYLQGQSQSQIAKAFSVSQQQVSLDLKAIRALWLQAALQDFDARKAEELARIDAVEQAAWRSFEKSLEPREITMTEQAEGNTTTRKASVRREGTAGDPRWLERIQKCIDQRIGILGLNAPTRFRIDWEALDDDQLRRLAEGANPQQVIEHVIAEA
jgi:hypothetical protein